MKIDTCKADPAREAALLASASAARAATAEEKCQQGRFKAAAKYNSCQQKVLGKFYKNGAVHPDEGLQAKLSKCRVKYTDTWARLQNKAAGSGAACTFPRYDSTVAGTVSDRLTQLQWTKTQNLDSAATYADPRDADNIYSWNAGAGDPWLADGTVFTDFLEKLNTPPCHADQCDWRLPTISELQTILLEPYPCETSPCIDESIFGPTVAWEHLGGHEQRHPGAGSVVHLLRQWARDHRRQQSQLHQCSGGAGRHVTDDSVIRPSVL